MLSAPNDKVKDAPVFAKGDASDKTDLEKWMVEVRRFLARDTITLQSGRGRLDRLTRAPRRPLGFYHHAPVMPL
jgi:hypothetical protein